ncbi:MAG: Na(+)/glucose symporter [Planctomycetota bacterium]|jgi:Na+/proline symporter
MHPVDWVLVAVLPALVIWDGVRRGSKAKDLEGFLLAGRSVRWWAIGLSVMATQASAITMISIAGHGYEHGMRWLHIYLALPFAMVILCTTVVPWFTRARVYTAYEYLEQRFDGTTRTLASVLFLVSRGLAVGTSLYAPSIVLNLVLGIPQGLAIMLMGGLSAAYTVFGGNAAVIFTDVKQMLVMFLGIGVSLWAVVQGLPADVGFADALSIAGASGRMEAIHVAPDVKHVLADRYNLLSALLGGLFLFLGYFGADQSQVQRYLAGANVDHSRASLLVSAFLKVPMQFAILLLGSLIFVFYMFQPGPVFFRADAMERAMASAPAEVRGQWEGIQQRFETASVQRREAALGFVRAEGTAGEDAAVAALEAANREAASLKREANALHASFTGAKGGDNDFIFTWFFLREMPTGLLGLVIAAIFVAAMSSLDAQLNSLATSSVMDLYARFRPKTSLTEILRLSRWATMFWGLFATVSAFYVAQLGQMIEAVNIIGSMFYGSLFGVFMLGWLCPWARGAIGWLSLAGGFLCTLFTHFVVNQERVLVDGREVPVVGFLWYNLIGCGGVVGLGFALAFFLGRLRPRA